MTQIVSGGFIQPAPGVFVGGTDFSELSAFVGATSWPAAFLRELGGVGNQTIQDNLDGEGVVVAQNDTNAGNLIINRYEDLFQFGEILVRFFVDGGGSGVRMKHGQGAFREAGGPEATFAIFETFGSLRGAGAITPPAQATGVTSQVDYGALLNRYLWLRVRFDDAGGGNTRIRINLTDSAFTAAPAVPTVWDIDEVSSLAAFQPGPWGTRLGWLRTTIGPTQLSDRRISFLAFSTDPDNFPVPFPQGQGSGGVDTIVSAAATILAPTITVNPLQGTYVGLRGSPFEAPVPPTYPASTPPSFITDAIGAWEFSNYREDAAIRAAGFQNRVMRDLSRTGNAICMGDAGTRDSYIDYGPFSVGKVGVVCGGVAFRVLQYDNTGQRLNFAAAPSQVRFTVNFSCALDRGQTIVSQGSSTDRSWIISVLATGVLDYSWSQDGTTSVIVQSTVSLNTVFADWQDAWIRVTHDFDTDQVTFETSVNGTTWVQLGAAVATTAAAGLNQPADTLGIEFGAFWLGQNSLNAGGAVYQVTGEQDIGAGLVTVYDVVVASTAPSEFSGLASQGLAGGDSLIRTNAMRMTTSEFQTFFNAAVLELSNQFNAAPGEVLTVVLVAAMDQIEAGAGSFRIPFAQKETGAVGQPGYGVENDGGVNGYDFRGSNGVTQQATPVAQLADNFELFASVYEIDGPDGEIRMRDVGQAPQIGVWNDQGAQCQTQGFIIGATGQGFNMTQDFLGAAVFKRELTTTEMAQMATFLSNGRF